MCETKATLVHQHEANELSCEVSGDRRTATLKFTEADQYREITIPLEQLRQLYIRISMELEKNSLFFAPAPKK